MDGDGSSHGTTLGRWWGQTAQPSPSTDVMNQLCRVCGEPAAGFHFGAFTCEGCKSFFGRTYNNIGSITECKNNGECVINKKNRTACKACRLRKCLLVGMSKSGSRYGRRSNWFKIHCLLQEQQQAVGTSPHIKDKSALALWGENYKNLSLPSHFDNDSKSSPTDETLNNNSTKEEVTSPSRLIPPNPYTAEAAAALWAARNSFIPMQLPPHHLPMPFLTSPFGNFHPPHPPRNFLLPFMQNIHSPNQNATLTVSSSPSRSSPGTSPSPRSSPSRNYSINTPLSETSEKQRLPERNQIDERTFEKRNREENSVAKLRALGPFQEHPIDLSTKECDKRLAQSRTECSEGEESCSSARSESSDRKDENFNKRKKPLDLTKSSHIES